MKRYKLIKFYPIAGANPLILMKEFQKPDGIQVCFKEEDQTYIYVGPAMRIVFNRNEIESFPKFWEKIADKQKYELKPHQKVIMGLLAGAAFGFYMTHQSGIGKTGYAEKLKIELRLLQIQADFKKLLLEGKPFPTDLISERAELITKLEALFPRRAVKPPLGILPKQLHDEIRLDDLNKVVERYLSAKKDVPAEWLIEKKQLEKSLNEKG